MTQTQLLEAVKQLQDPETGRPLGVTGQALGASADGDKLVAEVGLTSWASCIWSETTDRYAQALRAQVGADVEIVVRPFERPAEKIGQIGLAAKSVIAVGSGKGGVGKSTIAATLALGLHRAGSKVGLMDADVYGPSIPHLLGITDRPHAENNRLQPVVVDGMPVMSMGLLVPKEEAVVWRGPMLHGAITQFLKDTDWGNLDYLIIDMPPGTGDIALTLSQLLPLTGAVVVCTPQDVALLDAVKAIAMYRKVGIPLLGVVENMSYFACGGCGARHDIFGSGGAKQKAAEMQIPLLAEVPINVDLRKRGDDGRTVDNFDDPASAEVLMGMCRTLVRGLAEARLAAPPMPSLPVL
ncbi:Flagellum site-determining protein YlxH [Pirellulimonas nuda]|uniref:Iron-sulfur cluster carrier protein n=1 Tax=Pirellulimonas nuda TaxID=2528009 RepID=A0A518D8R9_9BACT|nr:Mrp/NBP35 family ATP-binding protein [Pirellulimonas nuda]QDU87866.1 Flagellum site-determining protein YlxH [Pirellulimonas nuda]